MPNGDPRGPITATPRQTTNRLLDVMHVAHTSVRFKPLEIIFAQGDPCAGVMYIQTGRVTLTSTSRQGRDAVVGTLKAGAFFGEGALAGQRRRRATAKTTTGSTIGMVKTGEMRRSLHLEIAFADWFRSHLLVRNLRIEAGLVDQLSTGARNGSRGRCCCSRISTNINRCGMPCRRFRETCWPR